MPSNTYSNQWFQYFGDAVDPAQTHREIELLKRVLPLPAHRKLLDVCCGSGRHVHPLARAGYVVTGLDSNAGVIAPARKQTNGSADFQFGDMRSLSSLAGDFDALICMWQSFGQFNEATNHAVFCDMADRLRPGGRMVFDVYNRDFFEPNQGTREHVRGNSRIIETKRIEANRLFVHLAYANGASDSFEWRLYRLGEWHRLFAAGGVVPLTTCCEFNEQQPPRADVPRMQFVLQKSAISRR